MPNMVKNADRVRVSGVVFMASPENGVDGEELSPECKLFVHDEHENGTPDIYVEVKLESRYRDENQDCRKII